MICKKLKEVRTLLNDSKKQLNFSIYLADKNIIKIIFIIKIICSSFADIY